MEMNQVPPPPNTKKRVIKEKIERTIVEDIEDPEPTNETVVQPLQKKEPPTLSLFGDVSCLSFSNF